MKRLTESQRASLLDRLIVWMLGVPGKEKQRLAGLYKQGLDAKTIEDIKKQISKYPELKDKYKDLF